MLKVIITTIFVFCSLGCNLTKEPWQPNIPRNSLQPFGLKYENAETKKYFCEECDEFSEDTIFVGDEKLLKYPQTIRNYVVAIRMINNQPKLVAIISRVRPLGTFNYIPIKLQVFYKVEKRQLKISYIDSIQVAGTLTTQNRFDSFFSQMVNKVSTDKFIIGKDLSEPNVSYENHDFQMISDSIRLDFNNVESAYSHLIKK